MENKEDATWNSSATLSITLTPTNMDIFLMSYLHKKNYPSMNQPLPRYFHLPQSSTSHSSVSQSPNRSSTWSSLFESWSEQTAPQVTGVMGDDRRRYSFPSSHSVSPWSASGIRRVNVTCFARISTLTFHTSTWTSLAFPSKRGPIVGSKLFGISGEQAYHESYIIVEALSLSLSQKSKIVAQMEGW